MKGFTVIEKKDKSVFLLFVFVAFLILSVCMKWKFVSISPFLGLFFPLVVSATKILIKL